MNDSGSGWRTKSVLELLWTYVSYELKVIRFVRETGFWGYHQDDPHSGAIPELSGSVAEELVWNHFCIYTASY